MYPWADPDKLLDEKSLDQLILFYRYGWEAQQTQAQVYWGVLGQALSGDEPAKTTLEEFKKSHPDAVVENGAWKVSR